MGHSSRLFGEVVFSLAGRKTCSGGSGGNAPPSSTTSGCFSSSEAAGLAGAALGLLLTAVILFAWPVPWLLGLSMLASGIGQGLFQVGYMEATTTMLPIEERGVAGSLISVTRLLGIVFGATGIGWLQGVTADYAASFAVLGGGLALFAAAFAVGDRRAQRRRPRS